MATNIIIINSPSDDEDSKSEIEQRRLLRPPSPSDIPQKTFKPLPQTIIRSIENNRKQRFPHSRSTSDFYTIQQSSIDTTDDDIDDNYETTTTTTTTNSSRKRLLALTRIKRSPSDVRVTLFPNENVTKRSAVVKSSNEIHSSDQSLDDITSPKQKSTEHRLNRRIHTSLSSATLRSIRRNLSAQSLVQRSNRRQTYYLSRNSKWHFVRNHLHDVAMMSQPYARMKAIERNLRWMHLREEICKQVLDMREISILRQQDDGIVKKHPKTGFDLKSISPNEVVYVEHDGQIHSMGIRDLVVGRFIRDKQMTLDAWAQLDARRKIQVQQDILKQQEGRARLKRHIAFSFCLCNLSFIILMFAAMFVFATTVIVELRSKEFL
ncbi:unnamed protein product [Rotaria socialis]|uniref:Uncharacterized protein n=2 Tax=Rotaria socialis TaxID=392032 RepID=A0A817TRN8_9BILA|nr:unnamed protein product [Rotaria socialis]CAF3321730.1 unnamed protein product [Rotaria socialis]CAF3699741.1 unnamed protein product [Rotaria socialis]CAF4378254.1 unnamed protein product [Rotaria socialis]CAF4409840.1 unnamed protein product [Rotaria socialis]